MVHSRAIQSRFATQPGPADSPQNFSHNLTATQNNGELSTCLGQGAFVRSPSIESVPYVFKNDPPTSCIESPEGSESLFQKPNLLAPNSWLSPTTNSSGDSLDSDMFSISDFSDNFEPADPQGTVHLIVNQIAHRLYAGYRTSASLPPSNDEGSSDLVASTIIPGQRGNVSRSSRKRKFPQDEEDDTGEDGSNPRRPKKPKLAQGENSQNFSHAPT